METKQSHKRRVTARILVDEASAPFQLAVGELYGQWMLVIGTVVAEVDGEVYSVTVDNRAAFRPGPELRRAEDALVEAFGEFRDVCVACGHAESAPSDILCNACIDAVCHSCGGSGESAAGLCAECDGAGRPRYLPACQGAGLRSGIERLLASSQRLEMEHDPDENIVSILAGRQS